MGAYNLTICKKFFWWRVYKAVYSRVRKRFVSWQEMSMNTFKFARTIVQSIDSISNELSEYSWRLRAKIWFAFLWHWMKTDKDSRAQLLIFIGRITWPKMKYRTTGQNLSVFWIVCRKKRLGLEQNGKHCNRCGLSFQGVVDVNTVKPFLKKERKKVTSTRHRKWYPVFSSHFASGEPL